MKRIFGRVLVKETNAGIANLVVAAFDHDSDARALVEAHAVKQLPLGHRLGSVITDAQGNFSIDADACEPAGGASRPDLVIAVFAPEDVCGVGEPFPRAADQRLLHVSHGPRVHAGAVEAYVIRIPQAELDAYGIVVTGGLRPSSLDPMRHVNLFEQRAAMRSVLAQRIAPHVANHLESARKYKVQAKTALQGFSLASKLVRNHDLFAADATVAMEKHEKAIDVGARRLREKHVGEIALRLSGSEIESLGLSIGADGDLAGDIPGDQVMALMLGPSGGTDLARKRTLLDACIPATQHALDETDEDDTSGTPTTPVEEPPPPTPDELTGQILARVQGQLAELPVGLDRRPTLEDVHDELRALELKGGPADATAFHDFHVVQVAFKHIWAQAFDGPLRDQAEQLYEEVARLYDGANVELPPFAAIDDIEKLREFVGFVAGTGLAAPVGGSSTPSDIGGFLSLGFSGFPGFPGTGVTVPPPAAPTSLGVPTDAGAAVPELVGVWPYLSMDQQQFVMDLAPDLSSTDVDRQTRAKDAITAIARSPEGAGGRLGKLIYNIGKALAEPYAFDVFAPNTCNWGLMLTYRQKWEPQTYQVGELVATVPLAPNEVRKYSTKRVTKRTRAETEIEKSTTSRSLATSEIERAEAEIMKKASTATNFKMSSNGTFNIGIGSISASSEFGLNQSQDSSSSRKDFHEATMKAAEDYRLERSLEVATTAADETEQIQSGEISNPNNELTVTYLFYELERRFRVTEHLHRARPVVLVAQDVPAPHEIDEAWILQYTWILNRVLLDNSLRAALEYISSGFAGDEVSVQVIKARWDAQRNLLAKLEQKVSEQLEQRNVLRESLIETTEKQAMAEAMQMPLIAKIATFGLAPDPAEKYGETLKATAKSTETRLKYVEEALADAQKKLAQASDAFESATRDYAAALQNQFSRHVAIDQLRIHIKQNILYYMQAIWDHEPPDQRFFRLYNKKCTLVSPGSGWVGSVVPDKRAKAHPMKGKVPALGRTKTAVKVTMKWGPTIEKEEVDLVEIADLDNPIGYKGNYMIFPLRKPTFLTTFMLQDFIDHYFGVADPDELANYTIEELEHYVQCIEKREDITSEEKTELRKYLVQRLTEDRPKSDVVIVPTGQLFIEALPGSHPLLEDFKLRHRIEDMRKARAEVRHREMENLRLAARLAAGKLEDPEIEKRIIVDQGAYADT